MMDFNEGMLLAETILAAQLVGVCRLRKLTTLDLAPPSTTDEVRRFVGVMCAYLDRLSRATPSAGDRFRRAAADFELEAAESKYLPSFLESSRFMNNADLGMALLDAVSHCPVHDAPPDADATDELSGARVSA